MPAPRAWPRRGGRGRPVDPWVTSPAALGERGGTSGPEGRGRAGRGRGGRDPGGHDRPSCAVVELRHTAGRRQAGRSAGRQRLFSRGGAAKGVASYPLREAQRRAACTWLLDEGGRYRRPSRAGAGGHPACAGGYPAGAGGYPACARRASRGAVHARRAIPDRVELGGEYANARARCYLFKKRRASADCA